MKKRVDEEGGTKGNRGKGTKVYGGRQRGGKKEGVVVVETSLSASTNAKVLCEEE